MHIWSPPESPLRIEYAAELFSEVRLEGATGTLYGLKSKTSVRVSAARCEAGLKPVGIFAVRNRGEVFLTEADLERFEKSDSEIALVIAGASAGFFVRQRNGSIQSIKSYQEVACPKPPSRFTMKRAD